MYSREEIKQSEKRLEFQQIDEKLCHAQHYLMEGKVSDAVESMYSATNRMFHLMHQLELKNDPEFFQFMKGHPWTVKSKNNPES